MSIRFKQKHGLSKEKRKKAKKRKKKMKKGEKGVEQKYGN